MKVTSQELTINLRLPLIAHSTRTAAATIANDPFGGVDACRGFLPAADPLHQLSLDGAEDWEQALADVPKLIVAGGSSGVLRRTLSALPPFPLAALLSPPGGCADGAALWRAYLLLSFLSHAYMWCEGTAPVDRLPAVLAVPWAAVAARLDMPPVLVYATYNLYNWRRLDPSGGIELGNIVCLQVALGAYFSHSCSICWWTSFCFTTMYHAVCCKL